MFSIKVKEYRLCRRRKTMGPKLTGPNATFYVSQIG